MKESGKNTRTGQENETADEATELVDVEVSATDQATEPSPQTTPPEEAAPEEAAPEEAAPEEAAPEEAAPEKAAPEKENSDGAKVKEYWDRLVRTTADFENFRKRASREKQEAIAFANEALLRHLLTVLDSFDKALSATADSNDTSIESLQTGINMILQQFKSVLTEAGVSEIDATGQKFDPNWHEAISKQETTEVPEEQVIQQVRKGYKLGDRLLRAAMVVVAAQPAANPQA